MQNVAYQCDMNSAILKETNQSSIRYAQADDSRRVPPGVLFLQALLKFVKLILSDNFILVKNLYRRQ
jgi:hypothetical protein